MYNAGRKEVRKEEGRKEGRKDGNKKERKSKKGRMEGVWEEQRKKEIFLRYHSITNFLLKFSELPPACKASYYL